MTNPHFIGFDEKREDNNYTCLETTGNIFDLLKGVLSDNVRTILEEDVSNAIFDFFKRNENRKNFSDFLKEKLELGKLSIVLKSEEKGRIVIVKEDERISNKKRKKEKNIGFLEEIDEGKDKINEERIKAYLVNDVISKIEFKRIGNNKILFLNNYLRTHAKTSIKKYLNLNFGTENIKEKITDYDIIVSEFLRKNYDELQEIIYKKFYEYLSNLEDEEGDNFIDKTYRETLESVSNLYIERKKIDEINYLNLEGVDDNGLFKFFDIDDIIEEVEIEHKKINIGNLKESLSKKLDNISKLFFIEFGEKYVENINKKFNSSGKLKLKINVDIIYNILSKDKLIFNDLIDSLIEGLESQLLFSKGTSNVGLNKFYTLLKQLDIKININEEIGIIKQINGKNIKDQLLKEGEYHFTDNKDNDRVHIYKIFQKYKFLLFAQRSGDNSINDDLELIRNKLKEAIKKAIKKD